MIVEMMKCKIHRATVTEANLDYAGSITIDEKLMSAAGLVEYEKVHVLNITNGARLETYVIRGSYGSGSICINGAAAHLVDMGDLVIIVSYCRLTKRVAKTHSPIVVHVDKSNSIISPVSVESLLS